MKRLISLLVCGAMAFTLLPSISVFAAPSYCTELFEEAFEGDTPNVTFTKFSGSEEMVSGKGAVPSDADYGLGSGEAVFSNPKSAQTMLQFGDGKLSKGLRAGVAKGAGYSNYSVEVSFDWNPIDYNAGAPYTQVFLFGSDGGTNRNQILTMKYTGGDNASTSTHKIEFGNANGLYGETKVLNNSPWNITAADAKHAYRVRIVLKPYDTVLLQDSKNWAGSMKVYIDNNLAYDQMYRDSSKENYIKGLLVNIANKNQKTSIDNVKVVECYDECTSTEYSNDDAIVSAIRTAERTYNGEELTFVLGDAKTVHAEGTSAAWAEAVAGIEARKAVLALNDKVIHGEDFEDDNFVPFTVIAKSTAGGMKTLRGTSIDVPAGDKYYGLGNKYCEITNDGSMEILTHPFYPSQDICNKYTPSNDYKLYPAGGLHKAKISFDYIVPGAGAKVMLTAYGHDGTMYPGNHLTGLYLENDPNKSRVVTYAGDQTVQTGIDCKYDRPIRITITYNASDLTMKINIDGKTVYNGKYAVKSDGSSVARTKETWAAGISLASYATSQPELGYIDNIEYFDATSDTPVDKDALVAAIRSSELGFEPVASDFADKVAAAKAVYEDVAANQTTIDDVCEALELAVIAELADTSEKVHIEKIGYTTDDLTDMANSNVTSNIDLYTTRIADNTNDILTLSVLYDKLGDLAAEKVVGAAMDTRQLGNFSLMNTKDFTKIPLTVNLPAEADARQNLYLKTFVLSGAERHTISKNENDTIGTSFVNSASADKVFTSKGQLYKKSVGDNMKLSLSLKANAEDEILVYATKDTINGLDELTNEADLAYINVVKANLNGDAICDFVPRSVGDYNVKAYSLTSGELLFDEACSFEAKSEIVTALSALKAKTDSITTPAKRNLLQLDTDEYSDASAAGIDMDSVTNDVFTAYPDADSFTFKKEYLELAKTLSDAKTAGNLDEFISAVEAYGLKNTNDEYLWSQRCEYANGSRSTITNKSTLVSLLSYTPDSGNGGSSGGGYSGGGFVSTGGSTGGSAVTPQKTPYEENIGLFSDMAGYEWANEAVIFMAKNGIVNGKAEKIYAPADLVVREEFAKMVVNMFKLSDGEVQAYFGDVDATAWYAPFVKTASSLGVIKGIGDDKFGVGMNISRQDACVMIYRAAKLCGAQFSEDAVYIPFEDGCADYAEEAIANLAKSNIIRGVGNNILNGNNPLTRAEAAKMIYGLYTFMNN